MPSPEYYHRQADFLRMALLASEYEERLRLLDIANGYRANAVRVEACELSGPVSILFPQLPHMALSGLFKRARCTSAIGRADIPRNGSTDGHL